MELTTGSPARTHHVPAWTDAPPALEQLTRSGPALFATSFLGYALLALVSVQFIDTLAISAVLWPAAGLSVALLLLVPTERWPIILSGVALAELAVDTINLFPVGSTLLWTAGNVAGPLVAATIIRRLARHRTHLVPVGELVLFLAAAVAVGPLVGGTIGALGTALSGSGFVEAWPNYVLNDALGVLVAAPLLLSRSIRPVRDNVVEVGVLVTAFVATTVLIFAGSPGGWTASLPYLIIPVLVWGGLRFGTRGAAALAAVFAPTALVLTTAGFGPFDALALEPTQAAIALRLFLMVTASSALLLGSLVEDLMRRDSSEAILRHAATHDPLTDLPNRAALEATLHELLASPEPDQQVAVLMCDLDNFKVVNDNFGHHAGDALLVEVARELRGALRSDDVLARVGGDEFVVAATVADPSEVEGLAGRVQRSIQRATRVGGTGQIRPTFSVGVAVSDRDDDATALLRKADAAMYRAKQDGRSRVRLFDDELNRELEDRLLIETDVVVALREGHLVCDFQPELVIATGELFSFEALARWHHPRRGVLMPGRFIPAIERSGRSGMLFERTLGYTIDQQILWERRLGRRPPVSVNLSPGQLDDPSTVEVLARELERGGGPAESVWIEVTESALMGPRAGECLAALRSLGVRTAIDDFGTGWASMSRLAEYHWDALKIDQSFVSRLDDDDPDGAAAIVAAMVALAHTLGTLVVAEGVETRAQLDRLAEIGCDIVQGYLVSRPLPAARAIDHLGPDMSWDDHVPAPDRAASPGGPVSGSGERG